MMHSLKKVLVVGATGLVGKTLVLLLNQTSDCEQIDVIVRRKNDLFLNQKKIQQIVLDDFLLLNSQDLAGYSHVFSCLGSTLKQAGSKSAFYHVDYEMNVHIAHLLQNTTTHLLIVSSMGANAASPFFYNRVKGKLENTLQNLNLYRLSIIRPSLLIGQREHGRFLEDLGQRIYQTCSKVLPKQFKYLPVTANQVAHTMVDAARNQTQSCEMYANLKIQHYPR